MGFVEFLIIVIVVVLLAAVANYFVQQIPNTPAIFGRIIWAVAVLIIVVLLLKATGILSHDVQIPHI
jgi:asparagine N-glycosylation enzyme membrane subunit Stt3